MTGQLRRLGIAALVLALVLLPLGPAVAQGRILIRDAEIERILAEFTAPVLEAAGMGPNAIDLYIVKDPRLNAFVAGGMNLFLHTGFLRGTEHPGQTIGVIAHEVGHIAGGHLSRIPAAQQRAGLEMLASAVLGAAAAVAGAPQLGTAIIAGGQTVAASGLSRFSVSQEQAADQAAMTYLDRLGISPQGLAEVLRILDNQNALNVSRQSPYLQSHPLTRDRIQFVESRVQGGDPLAGMPEGWREAHRRMVVKLDAFLDDPQSVLRRFEGDASLAGRYARAIALYRLPDLARAVPAVEALIAEHPDNPYFHELKGQMLFENGRVAEAVAPYRQAVQLLPDSALLRVGLAQALIESGDEDAYREAIGHLETAVEDEPTNATAWRLLGIARGRTGDEGGSALALAESALLTGKLEDAELYARRAESRIARNDPAWLRLQDVRRLIEEREEERR